MWQVHIESMELSDEETESPCSSCPSSPVPHATRRQKVLRKVAAGCKVLMAVMALVVSAVVIGQQDSHKSAMPTRP